MVCSYTIKSTSLCTSNEISHNAGNLDSHTKGQTWLFKTIAPALLLLAIMVTSVNPCLALESGSDPSLSKDPRTEQSHIYSPLNTTHYESEPDHVNDQNLIAFEEPKKNEQVYRLSILDNSSDQTSENLDTDYKNNPFPSEQWYFDLSGGRISGNDEAYEDEIPPNDSGEAAAILPTLGYQNKFFAAEFSEQGLAAAMLTAGYTF